MTNFNVSSNPLDFFRGCVVDFDKVTGRSENVQTCKRYLSQMDGMFHDRQAYDEIRKTGDPVVYEIHELTVPQDARDHIFGF